MYIVKRLIICVGLTWIFNFSQIQLWDSIPNTPSTTVPDTVIDGYWEGQMARIDQEVANATDPQIVFFGNSITWGWSLGGGNGLQTWNQEYLPLNPINMGNSGDITPVMLYRLVKKSNLDFQKGVHPKLAVILAGTNNFHLGKFGVGRQTTPEEVAEGVRAIAQVFARRLPKTKILVLGIFPTTWHAGWRPANTIVKDYYDDRQIFFRDLEYLYVQADTVNREIMVDGIHPNAAGYGLWAQALDSLVTASVSGPLLNPVNIMHLGATITEGKNSSTSYRRYLDGLLRRAGHLIDFVGSRDYHDNNQVKPNSYEYDFNHEGHFERTTDWLAQSAGTIARDNNPEIVVIHLGTEDLIQGTGAIDQITTKAVLNISLMVDSLRAENGNVKIALSKIIPTTSSSIQNPANAVNLINQKISDLIRQNSTKESPIVVVDQFKGFDINSNLEDGVLPNTAGANKMAQKFFTVIDALIDGRGCMSGSFLEYDPSATISDPSLCQTALKIGIRSSEKLEFKLLNNFEWVIISSPNRPINFSSLEINILNISGIKFKKNKFSLKPWSGGFKINLSQLENGVHFIEIRGQGFAITRKVILY